MHNFSFTSLAQWIKGSSICLLVVLTFALTTLAQTQITTGTIQGTVTDINGAVVPGASVEIKNLDTNFSKTFTTDEGGRFVALALSPGSYSVTVSKQGFATAVAEKLELTVGQALNLPVSMKISQVQERVTITATPTVDTVKTESSTTLNETAVLRFWDASSKICSRLRRALVSCRGPMEMRLTSPVNAVFSTM